MLDRKALADSLHALHNSELKTGQDDLILKDAVCKIIDAISLTSSGLSEDDGRHLVEAIDALAEGHHFLARSSLLLILEGAPHKESAGHHPPQSLAELRAKLDVLAV